jgi:hypothetical protein
MHTLLRQVLIAILGGVVAASILLVANDTERQPSAALAQVTIDSPSSTDADAPHQINYQGQVYDPTNGAPLRNAGLNFSFRIYNNPSGTNQLFREDKFITTNADGFFSTKLGELVTLPTSIFDGQELYLRIYINDQELGPIQPIVYVPYAMWARNADNLGGYGESDLPKLIAYGVVDGDGDRASGENFSSSIQNVAGQDVYVIDIDNVNHSINNYTTIVTPACARPVVSGVGTSGEDLVVDMWDLNGVRTECRFEFMVLAKDK